MRFINRGLVMLPENLCYGSARGLSIGHVFDDIPEFFSGLAILFTSVDSDSNAAAHIYMNEKGVRALRKCSSGRGKLR